MIYNIRLAGVGGQGIITAGNIISEAAMRSGQKVIMSEIHGLSQRGGSVTVDVRIGDCYGPIISQGSCDLVIGLELIETFRATPIITMLTAFDDPASIAISPASTGYILVQKIL